MEQIVVLFFQEFKVLAAILGDPMTSKIYVANDHGGVALKNYLFAEFPDWPWQNLGTNNEDSVDYPDFAKNLSRQLQNKSPEEAMGLLICKSGQGMSMTANKFPFIRAALCWNEEVAHLSREHNNANVLCLCSANVDFETNKSIVKIFFNTNFSGGRHQSRVEKISQV